MKRPQRRPKPPVALARPVPERGVPELVEEVKAVLEGVSPVQKEIVLRKVLEELGW